jgi:hypothetical protein
MTDPVYLHMFCSKERKPHIVGWVLSEDGGLFLRYKAPMRVATTGREAEDFEAVEQDYRPEPGRHVGFDAYCPATT